MLQGEGSRYGLDLEIMARTEIDFRYDQTERGLRNQER